MLALTAIGWLVFIIGLGVLMFSHLAHAADPYTGRVVGIADGDTLTVLSDGTPHKIRLAEIDSPEKRQAFGERAKLSLSSLCFNVQAVVLPGKTDRYGRTVARVSCAGTDASLYQVQHGLAWAYTAYLTDPAIATAEQAARESGTGLWGDAEPIQPWLYRKGMRP